MEDSDNALRAFLIACKAYHTRPDEKTLQAVWETGEALSDLLTKGLVPSPGGPSGLIAQMVSEGFCQAVRLISMTPIGHYADGSPKWPFHTSLPSNGVRATGPIYPTPDEAQAEGMREIRTYELADRFGNMGELCGVAPVEGGYRAVINTYHSNT